NFDGTSSDTYIQKNLNDLLPPTSGWSLQSPTYSSPCVAINNSALIVGTATYSGSDSSIAPGQHGIILVPFDIVRKDDNDKYQPVDDIPVMVPGTGVGCGVATVPSSAPPVFTIQALQSLNSQVVDTLTFSSGTQTIPLAETGANTQIFSSSDGTITIEVLSPISFNENAYDTFKARYTNTTQSISNQIISLGETENVGVFRSMCFQMSLSFNQAPDPNQPDTIHFTISNSEIGDVISDTLTETGANTMVFSDSKSSIVAHISGTLSSGQIDEIDVEATFPDINANAVAMTLKETSASSLVFTNFASGSTTFANQTPRTPSEKVEVFRVRRYSGQTEDTIQMTVKTSVEEKPITLTRSTGGEFLSEKLIMIKEGENVSEIPEALLYTVIQVASDTDPKTKEIEFKDNVLQQTFTKKNALKPAFIGQSFTDGTLKQQGLTFVQLWGSGVTDNLGWALTGDSTDSSTTKPKFLDALPKSGFLAWFGHGLRTKASPAFTGIALIPPDGSELATTYELYSSELPSGLDYEFVFLNGCGSATPNNAGAADFISKFNAKAYLGCGLTPGNGTL
ncbi:MAG: hypothetical protein PHD76_08035, partial [Methylacidiphilales bacterium]|nr:hypothetical protein [Candidatus Methylacidiphilales bacterium]